MRTKANHSASDRQAQHIEKKTCESKSLATKPEVAEIKTRISKGAETSGRQGTP